MYRDAIGVCAIGKHTMYTEIGKGHEMRNMLSDLAENYWQVAKSQVDLEKKHIEMDGVFKKAEAQWEKAEMVMLTKISDLSCSPPL